MRQQIITNTDLQASIICMGSTSIGSAITDKDSYALLNVYAELGGNFIDTANIYADWAADEKSVSEKTIGKWLKQKRNRSEIILATKEQPNN